MHLNRGTIALFVLLSAAAVATWLARRPAPVAVTTSASTGDVPRGYYSKNATLLGIDEHGHVYYRVFAAELKQESREDALELESVRVEYAPETGVTWSMTAESGSAPSDRAYLDLARGVRLTNHPDDGSDAITIETEALRLQVESYLASTDDAVVMSWGKAALNSMGITADLKQDILEFKANVSARFPP